MIILRHITGKTVAFFFAGLLTGIGLAAGWGVWHSYERTKALGGLLGEGLGYEARYLGSVDEFDVVEVFGTDADNRADRRVSVLYNRSRVLELQLDTAKGQIVGYSVQCNGLSAEQYRSHLTGKWGYTVKLNSPDGVVHYIDRNGDGTFDERPLVVNENSLRVTSAEILWKGSWIQAAPEYFSGPKRRITLEGRERTAVFEGGQWQIKAGAESAETKPETGPGE